MLIVSAEELGRNLKLYENIAQTQPVFVERDGRPKAAMLSGRAYRRLKTLSNEPVEDNDNQGSARFR